jgi:hypothetical protein
MNSLSLECLVGNVHLAPNAVAFSTRSSVVVQHLAINVHRLRDRFAINAAQPAVLFVCEADATRPSVDR